MSVSEGPQRRAERAARNQALFRRINERVRDLNNAFSALSPVGEWICECADDTCVERIELSAVLDFFAAAPPDVAHTFDLAAELVANAGLGRLVSGRYPLDQYREAVDHAANAGARGATKIVFDLRDERERRL